MNLFRATERRRRSVSLENVENLRDRCATRRRRRHGDESVPAVAASYRLPPNRSVTSEIGLRNQAASALHLGGNRIGDAAAIKHSRPGVGDEPDGASQGRLGEARSDRGRRIVGEERNLSRIIFDSILRSRHRSEESCIDNETLRGETNRGGENFRDRQDAELAVRFEHSRDCARHTGSLRTDHAFASDFTVRADVHIARRGKRCRLAIIDRGDATVRHADHHVTATTEIPRLGVRNGESETRGNGGVDGVPTVLHDLHSHVRCDSIVARHHGVARERCAGTGREAPTRREVGRDSGRNCRIVGTP